MIRYEHGGIRTHDLWLRRPTLYPAELRARIHVVLRPPVREATTEGIIDGRPVGVNRSLNTKAFEVALYDISFNKNPALVLKVARADHR